MADTAPLIVWFRQDLRLDDNPALSAAARQGVPVLPVFVLDDGNAAGWRLGAASRWWLHQSLASLGKSLKGALALYRGDASVACPEAGRAGRCAVRTGSGRYIRAAIGQRNT